MKATIFTFNLLLFSFLICGAQADLALAQEKLTSWFYHTEDWGGGDVVFVPLEQPLAKEFCEKKGGRLPRIILNGNPVTSLVFPPEGDVRSISVEGVGDVNSAWPAALKTPHESYWTGTEIANESGDSSRGASLVFNNRNDKINVGAEYNRLRIYVVCIP